MQTLLKKPEVLEDMRYIAEQTFDDIIIVMTTGKDEPVIQEASSAIQDMCARSFKVFQDAKDTEPCGTVSCWDEDGALHYVPYLAFDVDVQRVYAFRLDGDENQVSFLVATDESLYTVAGKTIANIGKPHDFSRVCSFCGAAGRFRKCPCKMTNYCSTKCQHQHWKAHKTVCMHVLQQR